MGFDLIRTAEITNPLAPCFACGISFGIGTCVPTEMTRGTLGTSGQSWAARPPRYKTRAIRLWNAVCRSRHRISLAFLLCSCSVLLWPSAAFASGANGIQLRGHRGGGGQVPRARARAQHDAHRRGGVAQDAEELVVRVVRPQPRPRSPQVRLCPGHSCRLLQVPSPPHQLQRPRPPVVPSVSGHRRVLLAVLLPHRRGVVTRREDGSPGVKKRKQEEWRKD